MELEDTYWSTQASKVASMGEIGERIRLRRRELGLNQTELATVANTSLRFVSEVERGKETARVSGVLRLLAALGLELTLSSR
jgi:HTH-type transcriptional regulator / antitoxin HipB